MGCLRLFPGLLLLMLAGGALAGPPTVMNEGREFVELSRVADVLKTRLEATAQSTHAQLRPAGHVITVTRNWSRILVDGVPVVLDAPARVRRGVWLVPDTFLARVQPRVQPVTAVQPVAAGAPAAAAPPRLVLDFLRPPETVPSHERRDAVTPLRLIVLDAGHGGHDPGAVGPAGLQEKDLVLDVTRRVARLVEDRLSVKALLSRDGDHFIELRDRTTFANKERADLFGSIHANAHREATPT